MKKLLLWLVQRTDDVDYDEYRGAVVVARTEDDARVIHPDGEGSAPETWKQGWSGWPVAPADLTVTLIGTAGPSLEAGTVVCSDFKAG